MNRLRLRLFFAAAGAALAFAAPARRLAKDPGLRRAQGRGVQRVCAIFEQRGGHRYRSGRCAGQKLHLRLTLLPFPAGENLDDDLRNMVWKGHYLGYGPADLMLHVPVDNRLMAQNPKVAIFAPYHVEAVRLVRSEKRVPVFESLDSLSGKKIGVEKVSIA
ncbi:hypothetical protein LP419_14025 [Massilia sp. H-1]|nr:hypothetical protein LP419_14025 [Massilia sp. H-1]